VGFGFTSQGTEGIDSIQDTIKRRFNGVLRSLGTKTAALSGRGRASLQADLNISDQSNNEDGGYLTGSIQSLSHSGRSAIAMPSGARPVRILLTTFRV